MIVVCDVCICKCNSPWPLMSVGWSIGRLICHNFLKGTLLFSYRRTCFRPETPSTRPPTSTTKERRSGWGRLSICSYGMFQKKCFFSLQHIPHCKKSPEFSKQYKFTGLLSSERQIAATCWRKWVGKILKNRQKKTISHEHPVHAYITKDVKKHKKSIKVD